MKFFFSLFAETIQIASYNRLNFLSLNRHKKEEKEKRTEEHSSWRWVVSALQVLGAIPTWDKYLYEPQIIISDLLVYTCI